MGLVGNVESYYSKQIRFNKNNNSYPPTLKLKIFKGITKIFDNDHSPVSFENFVKPGSKAKAYIKCNGLWIFNDKFGMSWKVMKLISKPTSLSKKIMHIEPDIEEETEETGIMFIYEDYNKEFVDVHRKLSKIEQDIMNNIEYEIEELERNRNFEVKHEYMDEINQKLEEQHQNEIIEPDDVTYLIDHCSHHNHNQNQDDNVTNVQVNGDGDN